MATTKDKRAKKKHRKKKEKDKKRARKLNGSALKKCDLCQKEKSLLVRCMIDEKRKWHMVCGKCWKDVSGGVVDGDSQHPHYRYGGLWKQKG